MNENLYKNVANIFTLHINLSQATINISSTWIWINKLQVWGNQVVLSVVLKYYTLLCRVKVSPIFMPNPYSIKLRCNNNRITILALSSESKVLNFVPQYCTAVGIYKEYLIYKKSKVLENYGYKQQYSFSYCAWYRATSRLNIHKYTAHAKPMKYQRNRCVHCSSNM